MRTGGPRTFALATAAAFLLLFGVACGSDGDETPITGAGLSTPSAPPTTSANTNTGTPMTTPADTESSTPSMGNMSTMPAGAAQLGEVGQCLEENTDAGMVEDLRDGDTTTAEGVYESCLADVLPEAAAANLDPVIDQTAVCGQEASSDVTDEEIAALESGDREVAERISADTLSCLSDQLGIPLS